MNGFEARYFAVSRAVVWNSVPATLRVSLTVAHLNAYVFSFLEKRVEDFFYFVLYKRADYSYYHSSTRFYLSYSLAAG